MGTVSEASVSVWQKVLGEATQRSKTLDSTVLVLGDPDSGKRSLVTSLKRCGHPQSETMFAETVGSDISAIDYAFVDVKNIDDPDNDETVARLNVWMMKDRQQKELVKLALKPEALIQTVAIIALDFARPWTWMESLTSWVDMLQEVVGEVAISLPLDKQDALRNRVETYVRSFREPTNSQPHASPTKPYNRRTTTLHDVTPFIVPPTDESLADLPLKEGVLRVNLGIPLIVVCCKSDLVHNVEKTREEGVMEIAQRHLRSFCLTYAATLAFVSTKEQKNTQLLYDYLLHRLYNFSLRARASTAEKDSIFIPSGWDSLNFIKQLAGVDAKGIEKPFEHVIPKPATRRQQIGDEEVPVQSMNSFLEQLKANLEAAGGAGGASQRRPLQSAQTTLERKSSPDMLEKTLSSAKLDVTDSKTTITSDPKRPSAGAAEVNPSSLANFFQNLLNRDKGSAGVKKSATPDKQSASMRKDVEQELNRIRQENAQSKTPSSSSIPKRT
eukprot:GILK01002825.1.p1 GENE.GILK01002825.1~~GILK01002825.1.p1  ORF type:complete len:511 (+),score=101.26 GILK01002825.1:39-1535(+)